MENRENALVETTILTPGVGSSYSNGWSKLWKYFLELFVILVIAFVIGLPGGIGGFTDETNFLDIIALAYGILISGPVGYGVSFAYLKAARGEKLEIKDMFAAFQNYWNAVLASLLVSIIVGIGFFLLIIPGIIFACKLAFTPYLVVEYKMEVIEAIKESWRMTNGHAGTVFLIGLLGILIAIAGLICFGVGIIIAIMWISLASASLYHTVSSSQRAAAQSTIA